MGGIRGKTVVYWYKNGRWGYARYHLEGSQAHHFRAAVDGLAWDGARFYAADAAVLHRTSIPRLCELTLTAAVREHNNLALEVWRAANPDKPPA